MSSADVVVLRGNPDAVELAALVVVLHMLGREEDVAEPRREDSVWGGGSGWRSHGNGWRTEV